MILNGKEHLLTLIKPELLGLVEVRFLIKKIVI